MSGAILVIEDEKAMRLLVEDYLELLGYRVLTAPDGKTALELAGSETIRLAIVDINLPDISGVEVMRRLRATGVGWPFLILSGNLRESYAEEIVDLNVGEVMEKPVDLNDLEKAIRRLAGGPSPEEETAA